MIETERLLLVPATIDHLEALVAGDAVFERRFGWAVAPGWLDFEGSLPIALLALRERRVASCWWTYLLRDRATGTLVGSGGFKGAPTARGDVEIGYGIAPAWRRRGLATDAARALVAWAFTRPEVARVLAHTLGDDDTSARVLRRAGFLPVGPVVDPDDGPVWQWEVFPPAPV